VPKPAKQAGILARRVGLAQDAEKVSNQRTNMRSLVIGYGNADRQDDGAGWHILDLLADRLGLEPDGQDLWSEDGTVCLHYALQLAPELAEFIAQFERVCFVDAHTGQEKDEFHAAPVEPEYQSSAFTHHMTPATCMLLAEKLYGKNPEAILFSVRGYVFGFQNGLSEKTTILAEAAARRIWSWLQEPKSGSDVV
jgi:hydrogenase maturation protease